jgi:predicted RNA-binding Zn-ribbon protein involved in translation (DUF1610 family)
VVGSLREGEVVVLPCRFCASVSIPVTIHPGSTVKTCPKCGRLTDFTIERNRTGMKINSKSAIEPSERGTHDPR